MDIHRARFIPYPASTINCLAFSQSTSKDTSGRGQDPLRLAVGRANGNIEIWNPARGDWVHEITLSGGRDRSVEGLVWTQDPDETDENTGFVTIGRLRLFSIGYSSAVTEWDLTTGLPRRHCSGNYAELWCIAAQPRWTKGGGLSQQAQDIVVGCADGTLVVLSTEDDDLKFWRFLTRPTQKKSRTLSVTFQSRDVVIVGSANGSLGIYDLSSGNRIRNVSLGAGPKGGPKEILVWTVKCLPNGTIVTGDSTGDIRFYDGVTYTQMQRISAHESDVLDLVVSKDGQTIFSCGTDRRTVVYKLVQVDGKRKRWAKFSHNRFHKHDVKAMAAYESKSLSLVASGGVDTNLTIIPLREYGTDHHRAISGLPQRPPLCSASSARLVVSWWEREVFIWRVRKRLNGHKPYKLVAHIHLKGDENVTSASISDDGEVLAVSTNAETKAFHLSERSDEIDPALRVRKIDSSLLSKGARLVQISHNGRWLAVISLINEVSLYRFVEQVEVERKLSLLPTSVSLDRLDRSNQRQNAMNGTWGRYDSTITNVAFSHGDDVLVVADIGGYMDSWTIEGFEDPTAPAVDMAESKSKPTDEDSDESDSDDEASPIFYGQRWTANPRSSLLPKLSSSPLVLTFRPPLPSSSTTKSLPNGNPAVHPTRHNPHPHSHTLPALQQDNRLLVLTSTHQLLEFDILAGSLTPWSARNGSDVLARSIPGDSGKQRDRVMGAIWDITSAWERVWLYGSGWMMMLDLAQDVPPEDSSIAAPAINGDVVGTGQKRKRRNQQTENDLRNTISGAGSKIPTSELKNNSMLGRAMQKQIQEGSNKKVRTELISLEPQRSYSEDANSDADDDDAHLDGLAIMQRRLNGTVDEGNALEITGTTSPTGGEGGYRRWWVSHKYRPIFGIVPLAPLTSARDGAEFGADDEDAQALPDAVGTSERLPEVVLVERPFWDLDLPPRFTGVHER